MWLKTTTESLMMVWLKWNTMYEEMSSVGKEILSFFYSSADVSSSSAVWPFSLVFMERCRCVCLSHVRWRQKLTYPLLCLGALLHLHVVVALEVTKNVFSLIAWKGVKKFLIRRVIAKIIRAQVKNVRLGGVSCLYALRHKAIKEAPCTVIFANLINNTF